MKTAYRLLIGCALAVLAYGMATAAHRDHPWYIVSPVAVLAACGALQTRRQP